jgi:protein O-GlcNAc transferase
MNRQQRRAASRNAKANCAAATRATFESLSEINALFDTAFRHLQSGNLAKAEELCRVICAADRNHADSIHVLGLIAHQRGQVDDAIGLMKRTVALNPQHAIAHNNLGVFLCQIGNFVDGRASYMKAITLKPDYAIALNNLGAALTRDDRPDEAVEYCQRALKLRPSYAEAHYNLASAFHLQGKPTEAVAHFGRAQELNGNYAEAKFAMCMAELPILYMDHTEISAARATYERRLRALLDEQNGSLASFAKAIGAAQPFQLAYQGYNDRELQSLYGSFVCRIMADRYPPASLTAFAALGEPVRVGFVSGYFRQHSNWKIPIKGWIAGLDRRHFRIFGYYTGTIRDTETAVAAKLCDHFVQGPLSDDDWRQAILADAPHVLIYPEVNMDPTAARLAAQRLAPVQCNSWGHPESSGFPTLDYYLSSELMEPSDGKEHYSERLICLPNLSIYYEPTAIQLASTNRQKLGLRSSATVFWCGQSLFKFLPQFDQIYPRIALEVVDCQFVFIHFPTSSHIKALFNRRLDQAFREHGLKFEEHCVILPQMDQSSFAAVMGQCDIVLDTIGWSGCNSTLESMQFDLPVVTMPGPLMRGRHSMAILSMMDVRQTIAEDVDEYVAIAVRLAKDLPWRMEIKSTIARNKHQVYCDEACISALEGFLMSVARDVHNKDMVLAQMIGLSASRSVNWWRR